MCTVFVTFVWFWRRADVVDYLQKFDMFRFRYMDSACDMMSYYYRSPPSTDNTKKNKTYTGIHFMRSDWDRQVVRVLAYSRRRFLDKCWFELLCKSVKHSGVNVTFCNNGLSDIWKDVDVKLMRRINNWRRYVFTVLGESVRLSDGYTLYIQTNKNAVIKKKTNAETACPFTTILHIHMSSRVR